MNEKIMSLILQSENEYIEAVKRADAEAEIYAKDCLNRQTAKFIKLKQEWERFEKDENKNLKDMLSEAEQRIEKETAKMKERLKVRQQEKADIISERLKEEVLSIYGNH